MDSKIQATDGKSDEGRRSSKRPRPVTVKVIERQRKAVLVEWMDKGQYRRATIPASELQGDKADAEVLAQGVPYGVDWSQALGELPKSDEIANDLRRRQIWTADDFKRGGTEVRAAIQRILINPLLERLLKEL